MTDDERVTHYIELWKQTVAVQQHFNDLEWKIRQLALTAMTFTLGAAGLAAKDRRAIQLFGWKIQLSSTLLLFGLLLWLSFYFVDQVWYHRLLVGAVKHGEAWEEAIRAYLPEAGLTAAISAASPYKVSIWTGPGRRRKLAEIHSRSKLRFFYAIGAAGLIVAALALQVSAG